MFLDFPESLLRTARLTPLDTSQRVIRTREAGLIAKSKQATVALGPGHQVKWSHGAVSSLASI